MGCTGGGVGGRGGGGTAGERVTRREGNRRIRGGSRRKARATCSGGGSARPCARLQSQPRAPAGRAQKHGHLCSRQQTTRVCNMFPSKNRATAINIIIWSASEKERKRRHKNPGVLPLDRGKQQPPGERGRRVGGATQTCVVPRGSVGTRVGLAPRHHRG